MAATLQAQQSRFKHTYLISAGILITAMLVATCATLFSLVYPAHSPDTPHPLSNDLEYIGRYEYGCNFLCGSHPGETYFYGTDLTPPELARHFSKSSLISPSQIDGWKEDGPSLSLELKSRESTKTFMIDFTVDSEQKIQQFNLRKTKKKHVIEINKNDYDTAKNSL